MLEILTYPDKRLQTVAKKIEIFDQKLKNLADSMYEIMYENNGIGLAATQVNKHIQLVVMDLKDEDSKYNKFAFVNPRIEVVDSKQISEEEGCLSVPKYREKVFRNKEITLYAQDLDGNNIVIENASGLLGICIQHECDHLNGKLFIDQITSLKKKKFYKLYLQ
jgi:peptide deformylase